MNEGALKQSEYEERLVASERPSDRPPTPLSDPLLVIRKVLLLYILVNSVLFLVQVQTYEKDIAAFFRNLSAFFLPLAIVLLVIPSRRPDILFLRSFAMDSWSENIRRTIELCLSPLRVAGIRDPKRRIPTVFKPLLEVLVVWIYASNRRMNLEAGPDWRFRLIASLSKSRVVIIDYRHPTEFLTQELRICLLQMNPEQMVLILNISQDMTELYDQHMQQAIKEIRINDDEKGLKSLAMYLEVFNKQLPDSTDLISPIAIQFVGRISTDSIRSPIENSNLERTQYALGWVIAVVFWGLLGLSLSYGGWLSGGASAFLAVAAVFGMLLPWTVIAERWRRRKLSARLGIKKRLQSQAGGYLCLAAGLTFAFSSIAMSINDVRHTVNDYETRAKVAEIFYGAESVAKISYAEFYLEHARAPDTAELKIEMGQVDLKEIRVEMKDAQLVLTIDSPSNTELHDLSLTLTPIHSNDDIQFSCMPSEGFPTKYLPRHLCGSADQVR